MLTMTAAITASSQYPNIRRGNLRTFPGASPEEAGEHAQEIEQDHRDHQDRQIDGVLGDRHERGQVHVARIASMKFAAEN